MKSTLRRALVATGTAGALVAGLGVATLIGSSAAGAATGRATIHYRVNSNGTIQGTGRFEAGLVAIKLDGFATEQLQVVKPFRSSYTTATLAKDANAALQAGNPSALEGNFALAGGASPHSVAYLRLEPGKYFLFDPNKSKILASRIRTIQVHGKRINANVPSYSTVEATGMHTFGHAPSSIPANGRLHFANKSSDWHFIELDRLRAGKTFADVKKALKGQEPYEKVFYTSGKNNNFAEAVVSPGRGEVASYSLNKGNYAMLCFFPDHRTHIPHAFEGMVRAIKVS